MSRLNFLPVLIEYSFRQRGNAIIIELHLVIRESFRILSLLESEHWWGFLWKKFWAHEIPDLFIYKRYLLLFQLLIMRQENYDYRRPFVFIFQYLWAMSRKSHEWSVTRSCCLSTLEDLADIARKKKVPL